MRLHNKKETGKKRLVIRFKGKKYSFSTLRLILFPLGLMISIPLLLQIFENVELTWLQELFTKHMVFFLNLIFNIGAQVMYVPEYPCPWYTVISSSNRCYSHGSCFTIKTYTSNGCTGFLSMSIFVAIILFSPHSRNPKTRENVFWRKSIATIAAISLIYLYNVLRATIQVYLYSQGYKWSVIHDSEGMLAITVGFHIAFFLLCSKIVPECFLSLYYSGKLIINQITKKPLAEVLYDIKHRGEREQYKGIRKLFRNEGLDIYFIKIHEIDFQIIQFLNNNNQKYTAEAIKNRLFAQQEKISISLLEKILVILADSGWVLTEDFKQKTYYYLKKKIKFKMVKIPS